MPQTVGIPRALLYYRFYPAWEVFFQSLGAEVKISGETTREIVDIGIKRAVDEACLPVKIFFGHVCSLAEHVDSIFLPRIISTERDAYYCPKIMGLPDMIRNNCDGLPLVLDPTFDRSRGEWDFLRGLFRLGRTFTRSRTAIICAGYRAWEELKRYRTAIRRHRLLPARVLAERNRLISDEGHGAWKMWAERGRKSETGGQKDMTVVLLGHTYNINDDQLSMSLVDHLQDMGVEVLTSRMLADNIIERNVGRLDKELYWILGRDALGAAYHFLYEQKVDGVIYLASFACGPDSLIGELIGLDYKQSGRPFMLLTIDEHSGDAGMLTRVEAFLDMIRRKEGRMAGR